MPQGKQYSTPWIVYQISHVIFMPRVTETEVQLWVKFQQKSSSTCGAAKQSWSCTANKCEGAPCRYYFLLPNCTDFTILTRGHKLLAASQDTFFPHTHVISRLGDPRIDPSTLLTSSRQYYVMVARILYSDQNHFLGTRHSFIFIWCTKLELFAWIFSKIW